MIRRLPVRDTSEFLRHKKLEKNSKYFTNFWIPTWKQKQMERTLQ